MTGRIDCTARIVAEQQRQLRDLEEIIENFAEIMPRCRTCGAKELEPYMGLDSTRVGVSQYAADCAHCGTPAVLALRLTLVKTPQEGGHSEL